MTLLPLHAPRSSLRVSQHGSVDTALKNLKACSRRLNKTLDVFSEEYRILERLYYKGNNQHRPAIFWRRVSEVRRFYHRLERVHIDQAVLSLRISFFDADAVQNNSRVLRGSWTHFPESKFLMVILQQLSAYSTLLNKMQARLLQSFESFNLAMQSGAFLQLILTLVALSSRMSLICGELQQAVQAISDIVRQIIGVQLVPITANAELKPHPALYTPTPDVSRAADVGGWNLSTQARIIVKRRIHEPQPSAKLENVDTAKCSLRKKGMKDEIDDIFGL